MSEEAARALTQHLNRTTGTTQEGRELDLYHRDLMKTPNIKIVK